MDHDKRIDKSITFVPVNIAILTVSDSRKADDDRSGDLLVGRVQEDGHNLAGRAIVTDDFDAITKQLASWVEDKAVDVIVATGGTGLTGRDGTPEAFRAIFEKGNRRVWRVISLYFLCQNWHINGAVTRRGWRCWWHLSIFASGFTIGLPRWVG